MSTCLNCGHADASGFAFCPRCGTRAAEGATQGDPLLGRTLNNKYRIEEKIGAGAMGTVYLGEHIGLKKKVALKILHPDLQVSDEALQRFQREGIAAGKFNHPHAIQIFDFDRGDGRLFYLAMEYVDGLNLTQFLRERQALPCDIAVGLARQLLSCLAEAHRHGIVHRDLKPDNIMVVEDARGELRLKVLDFGLSKLIHRRLGSSLMTQPGRLLGTPLYMAPEQIAGEEADARSDVYAAGLIIYEMLAGARPWQEEGINDVFMTRRQREAPSIAEDHPELDLPAELDHVIANALARDRGDRFASAEEMLQALEEIDAASPDAKPRRASSGAPAKRKAAAGATRATAAATGVSRGAIARTNRSGAQPDDSRARPRLVWIGVGGAVVIALIAVGFMFLGIGRGERPSRVRLIAADDRTDIEARYVLLLDEARGAARSRDTTRAMSAVDQALALACRDAEGSFVRAEIYAGKGDLDTALAEYRAAARADAAYVEPRVGMGWLCFDRGDLDAAEQSFTEAGAIDAGSAAVIAARGALALRRGDPAAANSFFERALSIDPMSERAHRYTGRVLLDRGDVDRAITHLIEAKRADPRSAETLAWLGEAYVAAQRFDDADAQFVEALAIDSSRADVRELRGALLLERGRTTEAVELLKQAVERHPDRGALWVLRGAALDANGDKTAALEAVKRGFDLGERDAHTRTLLGILYQRSGNLDLAAAEFEAALKEETDSMPAMLDLGLVLFAQGKYAEAAEWFERVLEVSADDVTALLHLGILQMDHLGDLAKARAHLERYVQRGGGDTRVKGWLERLR